MALRRAFSAPIDICAIHCCWMSQVSLACHRFQRLGFRSYTNPRKPSLRRCISMSPSQQPLKYKLTEKSLLSLEQGDLTRYEGDAIVNAGASSDTPHPGVL